VLCLIELAHFSDWMDYNGGWADRLSLDMDMQIFRRCYFRQVYGSKVFWILCMPLEFKDAHKAVQGKSYILYDV